MGVSHKLGRGRAGASQTLSLLRPLHSASLLFLFTFNSTSPVVMSKKEKPLHSLIAGTTAGAIEA